MICLDVKIIFRVLALLNYCIQIVKYSSTTLCIRLLNLGMLRANLRNRLQHETTYKVLKDTYKKTYWR